MFRRASSRSRSTRRSSLAVAPNGRRPSRTTRAVSARCISSMSRRPMKAATSIFSKPAKKRPTPRSTDSFNVSQLSERISMQRRTSLTLLAAAAALGCAPLIAGAQAWPAKSITYIVPFTPGGTTDVIGRTIAQGLSPALGQPVVVDNKPGAAGAVGATAVAKAKPDGYTLLGGTISTHAINASLYKDLPYDPVKDFEPITLVGFIPNALYVDAKLPINSVQDLIAFLKKTPDKRTFASSGSG